MTNNTFEKLRLKCEHCDSVQIKFIEIVSTKEIKGINLKFFVCQTTKYFHYGKYSCLVCGKLSFYPVLHYKNKKALRTT